MKKILITTLLLISTNSVFAAEEWLKGRPASGDIKNAWPAASQANNDSLDRLLAVYRQGMDLTYTSSSTITVTSGSVVCSNSDGSVRKFRQNTTSTNITFSNLDTGASASSTTYYVYAKCDADATTATFAISASSTSPSGSTYYVQLGSFATDSGTQMTGIINNNWTGYVASSPVSKTVNVTYQALTDGYLNAYGDISNASYASSDNYIEILSDSNSTPTTAIDFCYTPSSTTDLYCPVHAYIRKGDYYKVKKPANYAGATIYWTPIGR